MYKRDENQANDWCYGFEPWVESAINQVNEKEGGKRYSSNVYYQRMCVSPIKHPMQVFVCNMASIRQSHGRGRHERGRQEGQDAYNYTVIK